MSRLLLVGNEPHLIEVLRISLESDGHHIMTALDGLEAFEMVSGRLPNVVVTDSKMLCRLLRHAHPGMGLPVIVLELGEPRSKALNESVAGAAVEQTMLAVRRIRTWFR
jgi:CheY-like chemotaxis protein